MALTAWSIINVSSYVPLQIFFKWGCLRLRFLFFLPLPTFWLLFFFSVFFSCISFFYQLAEAQPNSTQLDSIRLQTQTPAFILASSWTGGPGRQAALLPLPFAAIVISLITKWGVDLQGECGAVRCSAVESNGVEWSAGAVGAATGDRQMGGSLKHFSFGSLAGLLPLRWSLRFCPAIPTFPPTPPETQLTMENHKFYYFSFFFIVFLLVVWFGWLVGWLPGWLAGWKYFLLPLLLLGVLILFPVIKSQSREVS